MMVFLVATCSYGSFLIRYKVLVSNSLNKFKISVVPPKLPNVSHMTGQVVLFSSLFNAFLLYVYNFEYENGVHQIQASVS